MSSIEQEVDHIKCQIVDHFHPRQIIVFGSFVHGTFGRDSDLDFLIVNDDVPQNVYERARIIRRSIQRNTPCDFFVFRQDEIDEMRKQEDPFIETIFSTGRILYGQ